MPLTMVVLLLAALINSDAQPASKPSPSDRVIAIDVLLEPDALMAKKAEAINAQLRTNYPRGYTLGKVHAPHITLVHRYVREKDLPAIESAVEKVVLVHDPLQWELTATGIKHGIWAGVAITTISVKPTTELSRLQRRIVEAVEPFAVRDGTADAFCRSKELPRIDTDIINYVENFVPNASGEKFDPHVTVGVAHEDFVRKLKAAPFESLTFRPASVAIYQLGNFGTAQKKLWQWEPTKD